MDRFEEFIVKKYPNRSPKVLLQKFQDADGTWFYGVKEVQDQSEAWQARQAEINRLEEWNSNQARSIKTYQGEDEDLKALLQKLIDDEYTIMRPSMAYEIQKALRGEGV